MADYWSIPGCLIRSAWRQPGRTVFKTPGGKDFAFTGAELSDSKYFGIGDGIGVRKEDRALLDAFNAALKAIIANGTYKKVNDKYFDFDMYGKGE